MLSSGEELLVGNFFILSARVCRFRKRKELKDVEDLSIKYIPWMTASSGLLSRYLFLVRECRWGGADTGVGIDEE